MESIFPTYQASKERCPRCNGEIVLKSLDATNNSPEVKFCISCDYIHEDREAFSVVERKCSRKKCRSRRLLLRETNYSGQRVYWEICPKCGKRVRYSKANYKINRFDLDSRIEGQDNHVFICPQEFDGSLIGSALHLISVLRSKGKRACLISMPQWLNYMPSSWDREFLLLPNARGEFVLNSDPFVWLFGIENLNQFHDSAKAVIDPHLAIQVIESDYAIKRFWTKYHHRVSEALGIPEWVWSGVTGATGSIDYQYLHYALLHKLGRYFSSTGWGSLVEHKKFCSERERCLRESDDYEFEMVKNGYRHPANLQFLKLLSERDRFDSFPRIKPIETIGSGGWEIEKYPLMSDHDRECSRLYRDDRMGNLIRLYPTTNGNVIIDVNSESPGLENAGRYVVLNQLHWNDRGECEGSVQDIVQAMRTAHLFMGSAPFTPWPKVSFHRKAFPYKFIKEKLSGAVD